MSSNPFDNLSSRVFKTVEGRMGYDARWTPTAGGSEQTARVLYGEPTEDEKLGQFGDSFNPQTFFMEYWDGDFSGLFESLRTSTNEYVHIMIRGTEKRFYIRSEASKYDGRNYRIRLEQDEL